MARAQCSHDIQILWIHITHTHTDTHSNYFAFLFILGPILPSNRQRTMHEGLVIGKRHKKMNERKNIIFLFLWNLCSDLHQKCRKFTARPLSPKEKYEEKQRRKNARTQQRKRRAKVRFSSSILFTGIPIRENEIMGGCDIEKLTSFTAFLRLNCWDYVYKKLLAYFHRYSKVRKK